MVIKISTQFPQQKQSLLFTVDPNSFMPRINVLRRIFLEEQALIKLTF